jgi:hypothetical protein
MINPAKPEIKAARPRTYTTLWDTIRVLQAVRLFCFLLGPIDDTIDGRLA